MCPGVFSLSSMAKPERFGTVRDGSEPFGTVRGRFGTVRDGSERYGTVRNGSERVGTVRDGSERFGTVRNGSERFGTVRNGSGRFGTVRDGSERLAQPGPTQPSPAQPSPAQPLLTSHLPIISRSKHVEAPSKIAKTSFDTASRASPFPRNPAQSHRSLHAASEVLHPTSESTAANTYSCPNIAYKNLSNLCRVSPQC